MSNVQISRRFALSVFAAAASSSLFSACGGGETDGPQLQTQMADSLGDLSWATTTDTTLDGRALGTAGGDTRKQALSAAAGITNGEFFAWAQTLLPAAFDPVGMVEGSKTFPHVSFAFRAYRTGFVLAVTTQGGVYVLFPDGRLEQFGFLPDYTCQVKPTACGGMMAGTVAIFADHHMIQPNWKNGKLGYVGGADGRGHEVAPGDIARVVWNSDRVGWGTKSTALGVPAADGTLRIDGVRNNDRGLWTIWTRAGLELWLDVGSAAGWGLAGDVPAKVINSQVEYGTNGYRPARVDFQSGVLTLDFGHNGLAGFSRPLVPGGLLFVWMSNTDGWYLESTKRGYPDLNREAGKYLVSIPGISCGQRGTVAVYKAKSGTGASVVWEDVPYAWFGVPTWAAGPKVAFEVRRLLHEEQHSIVLGC